VADRVTINTPRLTIRLNEQALSCIFFIGNETDHVDVVRAINKKLEVRAMRNKIIMMFSLILITLWGITICLADNPVVQTIYTADPFPMVHNGVCYLYTDHDEDVTVNNFYTMNDWKCYTSTDMVNWTDRGTVLSYKSFSWAQGDAWAGQCIYRNGKFYLYVPMTRANAGGARVIGVAVSDSPTGPFTDALGKPLITNNGAQDIDPTVFIDDDGQAYLYWGNGNLYYVKLNPDMISYSGRVVQVSPKPSSYVEGPWLYKRNGLYYMVYAGMGSGSENIAYATSTSPTGPWTSRGTIMPTQGNSFTNHPAVIDYKGNSYFFYHNGALPGGGSYRRSVCVEQFKYNADGGIPTVPWTTAGPPQVGNLNPFVATEAETICRESGVETENCSEGGIDVCNIENGDYIKVKGVDFGSGATSFEARVASATGGGNIELRLDSPTGTLVGTCAVSGTGGWQTWVTKSCNVSGATGVHDLYLKFTGGSGYLFNFNWWKFDSGITTPTPTPTTPIPTVTATPKPTVTVTATPTVSQNPTGCSVSYSQNDWGSGASVSITIKNNGATAINGWTLAWSFAGNQKITNLWNGTYTQNGTAVTVKNAPYNGTIPARGSVNLGFNISYSGANGKPTGFTLNGTACQLE
jgi:arabinoxylan arabinofuranohydrolase